MNHVNCLFWDLRVIKDEKKNHILFGKVAKVFWRAEHYLINHRWQNTVLHFLRYFCKIDFFFFPSTSFSVSERPAGALNVENLPCSS